MTEPVNASLPVQHHVSLRSLNTFGVEARASTYLRITTADQLTALHNDAVLSKMPRLILGGGSNLLLTRDIDNLVLHMANLGMTMVGEDSDHVFVQAQAGESWHGFVEWTLAQGYGGLENLSLIPGTVGAAPIQNIGAYGSELADYVHSLHVFDFVSGAIVELSREDCAFGYRDSVFKKALRDRAVIVDVIFALPRYWQPNLRYAELAKELIDVTDPSPSEISAAVIAIRSRKLPDPAVIGNAGSFFKNPVVSDAKRSALLLQFPDLVSYKQEDGNYKLAAGWLIDQCGWKGRALGAAGVHDRQALVLINKGGASGQEILQLAERIKEDVALRFGVALEIEPVVI
jgi:UDP-N-acetylmuramate dehydrogenase